jgi:hypothetical protein
VTLTFCNERNNMRNIFIFIVKLTGLIQLYQSGSYVASMAITLSQMARMQTQMTGTSSQGCGITQVMPLLGFSLLTLGLSYLFMFRTNWLADILGIKEEQNTNKLSKLSTNQILKVGITLIGVYIVANAIPELFKSLSEWIMTYKQYASNGMNDDMYTNMFRIAIAKGFISTILPSLLELCIGLFAAVKTDTIIRFISKYQQAEQPPAVDS